MKSKEWVIVEWKNTGCQVPNCENKAKWLSGGGFRYCDDHKKGKGGGFRRIKK